MNYLPFKTKICSVGKILFEITQAILEIANIDFLLEDDFNFFASKTNSIKLIEVIEGS